MRKETGIKEDNFKDTTLCDNKSRQEGIPIRGFYHTTGELFSASQGQLKVKSMSVKSMSNL